MMLRLSSGSLTARMAFRMASVVGMGKLEAAKATGYRGTVPEKDNRSLRSAGRHQLLLTYPGDQAYGGIRQGGPDRSEGMVRVGCPGVERPVGQEDEEQVVSRVDPDLGAGKAGVAVRGVADEGTEETGLLAVELGCVPAEEARAAVGPARKELANGRGAHPLALGPAPLRSQTWA